MYIAISASYIYLHEFYTIRILEVRSLRQAKPAAPLDSGASERRELQSHNRGHCERVEALSSIDGTTVSLST